ncbi:MAG: S49 family peptidase, partial [Polyangiaceae bacterium]|nr:S49 family peptidase [Polyangiaceae bacterium]
MRATPWVSAPALAAVLSLAAASAGASEPLPTSAEHVAAPGRSVAADDTTDAVVLNPANLAWLPGPELRWTWVDCPDQAVKVGCGHAWQVGTPLIFGLSTALRVDLVQPPWGGPLTEGLDFPYRGNDDYVWITWGLATKIGEHASFGFSLERTYSRNGALDGIFGINAALSARPDPHVALSLVARDFNRPRSEILPPAAQSTDSLPILDGRYTAAIAVRPTGRRDLEIGLEAQYWEGADQLTERATLGVDIPSLGRAYGSVELAHLTNNDRRGVVGTAGLELRFLGLAAGGGALWGNGLGGHGTAGGYVTAAISGYSAPGIPRPAHAVWIRLESTPSTRSHVALLERLWRLERRRDIDAVVLVVRAEPANSWAHAEEIADALRGLRARGKKVLCSFEDAGPRALYACASADRIVVSPGGGIRYSGLRAEYMYLRGLLDKIGVRADFVRIGPHKTAPEQFTNEHAGPVAREDHIDVMRQQEAVFVRNLSLYRNMSEEHVREVTRQGPFIATEAREAGLVDGLAFDDELERVTRELVGRNIAYEKYEDPRSAPATFGPRGRIGLLYLDGDIIDGRSQHIPILDMRL